MQVAIPAASSSLNRGSVDPVICLGRLEEGSI